MISFKTLFYSFLIVFLATSNQALAGRWDSLLDLAKASDSAVKNALKEAEQLQKLRDSLNSEFGDYLNLQSAVNLLDWGNTMSKLERHILQSLDDAKRSQAMEKAFVFVERSDDFVKAGYSNPIDYLLVNKPDAFLHWKVPSTLRNERASHLMASKSKVWPVIAARAAKIMDKQVADVMGDLLQGEFLRLRVLVNAVEDARLTEGVIWKLVKPSQKLLDSLDLTVIKENFKPIVEILSRISRFGEGSRQLAMDGLVTVFQRAQKEGRLEEMLEVIVKLDGMEDDHFEIVEQAFDKVGLPL